MLPVLSVILEYHMDDRSSSDRPSVRAQSLYCMCILHSRHFSYISCSKKLLLGLIKVTVI